jgi:predicted O-methyltransferase YrrM
MPKVVSMKSIRLLALLLQRPGEFVDRVTAVVDVRRDMSCTEYASHRPVEAEEGIQSLASSLGCDFAALLREAALHEIEDEIQERLSKMCAGAPFQSFHDGDALLARICYGVARALQPRVIVETGVCYGVTSAYLLQALAMNGAGELHSIDLPPLAKDADSFVGWFIPQQLRSRWTLHRGASRRVLPEIVACTGGLDLFVHDSLHTYRNMRREFEVAWPALQPGGVLIADDVEGNQAFEQFAESARPALSVVLAERSKNSLFGLMVKRR